MLLGAQIPNRMERVLHHLVVGRVPALVELHDERLETTSGLVSLRVEPLIQLHLVVRLELSDLLRRGHGTRHLEHQEERDKESCVQL